MRSILFKFLNLIQRKEKPREASQLKKKNDELEKMGSLQKSLNPFLFQRIGEDFKSEFDQHEWDSYRWPSDDYERDSLEIDKVLFYLMLYGNERQKRNACRCFQEREREAPTYMFPELVVHVSANLSGNKGILDIILSIIDQTKKHEEYLDFVLTIMEWAREKEYDALYSQAFLIVLDWDWRLVKKELYEFLEKGDDNFVAWIAFSFWHIYGDKAYADFKATLSPKELKRIESLNKEILLRYNNRYRVPPRILK